MLQQVEGESLGAEERGSWAARDVVAAIGEEVDENGQAEGDAKSTDPMSKNSQQKETVFACKLMSLYLRSAKLISVLRECSACLRLRSHIGEAKLAGQ